MRHPRFRHPIIATLFLFVIFAFNISVQSNICVDPKIRCTCTPEQCPDHPKPSADCMTPEVIECVNLNENEDILHQFPNHWVSLKKIVLTGNRFPRLDRYPMLFYGSEKILVNLREFDFSSNQIEIVDDALFCGFQSVERLNLSNNKFVFNENHTTFFAPFSAKLVDLKLKRFFGADVNTTEQLGHLQRLFEYANFRQLKILDLSSNSLIELPDDFLCPLKFLTDFSVGENLLTTLNMNTSCMTELRKLDLSYNRFVVLDANFMATMKDITKNDYFLSLYGNPFECNCNSTIYLQWILGTKQIFDRTNLTCKKASPKRWAGKRIEEVALAVHELDCDIPVDGAFGVEMSHILSVIFLLVLYVL